MSRAVHGEIELPSDAPVFTPAHVLVELEDISRADSPSHVVKRLKFVTGTLRGRDLIPFAMEVPAEALNERNVYSVRVHVDVNGSGTVDRGDYITMQTYPVLTRGHGDKVRVVVRRV
jgi:uncharacterized lipoprotein YbaY